MKTKIRKGDTVEVISGADKKKRGEVIRVLADERRVVVQGVNIRKKLNVKLSSNLGVLFHLGLLSLNLQLIYPM